MINCNGSLVSSFNEIPENFIHKLHTRLSISESLRYQNRKVLFWELHYFRIIAALRRHRFDIPMNYTMDYLETEVLKVIQNQPHQLENALIRMQFVALHEERIGFLISASEAAPLIKSEKQKKYTLDLFKESGIQSGDLSNLSSTNATLFTIGNRFAKENGLTDCVLLNEQKNIVETIRGSLYLFQNEKIITPNLASGCQDFVLRAAFIEWIQKNNQTLQLIEQEINPFELQKSQEILVVSLEKGGQSVSNYRKTSYESTLSQELFSAFVSTLA